MADIEVCTAVDRLLELCQCKLRAETFCAVKSQRRVLIEKQLTSEEIINMWSVKELVEMGLSPGAAAGLKTAFPRTAAGEMCP